MDSGELDGPYLLARIESVLQSSLSYLLFISDYIFLMYSCSVVNNLRPFPVTALRELLGDFSISISTVYNNPNLKLDDLFKK